MVAPDCRGQGVSTRLLETAEQHASDEGQERLQLIVGDLSSENRAIYRHLGWVEQLSHQLEAAEHVTLQTLTKALR